MTRDPQTRPDGAGARTTMHARAAIAGDPKSLDWLVARLEPLLVAQARYRLGPGARREVEPEDLVSGAWMITLPRLADLVAREGRITPVLLKFLTTAIANQVRNLTSRRQRRQGAVLALLDETDLEAVDETQGVAARVQDRELHEQVRQAIDELEQNDREIVILRGIEQQPAKAVSDQLGISAPAVDQRYSRALRRLRERLPQSVFAEID